MKRILLATFLFLVGISQSFAQAPTTLCATKPVGNCVQALSPISSAALAANQIIKAVPSSLYGFEVSADSTLSGAAWWVMVYDAVAAPVDGAVTPAKCYAMASGATNLSVAYSFPVLFQLGIVIGVSTTGCFTKTASTHAFISGDAP